MASLELKLNTSGMTEEEKMDLQVKQKKRAERVKKLEAKKAGDAAEKRNYRWAVTYQLREEEQRLMQIEDSLSFARETKLRLYNFAKFLDRQDKIQEKCEAARVKAVGNSNKGKGKLMNKGWYEGMEIEMASPNVIKEYVGHDAGVRHFVVSKDEKLMFSSSDDHTIVIWDMLRCTQLSTIKAHKGFISRLQLISAVPDGGIVPQPKEILSVSQDFSIRKWDAELRGFIESNKCLKIVENAHFEPIHCMDLSTDGKFLITCSSDKTINLFETKRMRKLHTFHGHTDVVTAVSFAPNGKEFVSTGGAIDPTIKQWDVQIFQRLPQTEWPPEYVPVHRGFFGKMRVNAGNYTVYEDRMETEKEKKERLEKERKAKEDVANFKLAASAARKAATPNANYSPSNSDDDDKESKDGESSDGTVENSDAESDRNSNSENKDKVDEKGVGATKKMWDLRKRNTIDEIALRGGLIRTFDMRKFGVRWFGHTGWINTCRYSRSGRRIATGSVDHTIKIWKPKDGTLVSTLTGHTDWVMSVTWSPDDERLISGGADHSVRIWNVKNRLMLKVLHGHADVVHHAVELPSGHVLSSSLDTFIKMWQIKPVPPYAPDKPKITKIDQYFMDISWEAPPAMGEKIIEYIIERREGAPNPDLEAEWGHSFHLGVCDVLELHIDELTPGISYQVRVRAVNKIGKSDWSTPSRWARTYAAEPLRIVAPSVETVTKTSIALSWRQPKDMGAHILNIRLQLRGGDVRSFGDFPDKVIEINDARKGAADVAHAIKHRAKEQLRKMKIKEGMKQIEVRRLRVRKKLLKIEVRKKRKALLKDHGDAQPGHNALLATVVTGLKPGVLYQFRVAAINRVGIGPWSRPSFSTATAATIPMPPDTFAITEKQVTSLFYEWKPPYDNGAIINGYKLRYRPCLKQVDGGKEEETPEEDEEELRGPSKTDAPEKTEKEPEKWLIYRISTIQPWRREITFLEPGTFFECQFAAINGEGLGPWCSPVIARTAISPPDSPDTAFPVSEGPTKMRVHFRRPYHNGGTVHTYKIRWRQGGLSVGATFTESNELTLVDDECQGYCPQNIVQLEFERNKRLKRDRATKTRGDGTGEDEDNGYNGWRSVLISGLDSSTVYEFILCAGNDIGFSEFNEPSDEVPTDRAKVPKVMDPPKCSEETMNTVDLTWEAPFHNGGRITQYAYSHMEIGTGRWEEGVIFDELDPGQMTATAERLSSGKTYVFRMTAINKVGQGKWSSASEEIRCPTKMEYVMISHKRKVERDAKEKLERQQEKERKAKEKAGEEDDF
jgi:WD40 repeat protein